MSELINTDEYCSKQNMMCDFIDNSRDKMKETIVSIMSNDIMTNINHNSDKVIEDDFKNTKNHIYIE